MRTSVCYWKCDNPLSVAQEHLYNDKYAQAEITGTVRPIASEFPGTPPDAVRHTRSAGNHCACLIDHDGSTFFRSNDGKLDDDYMLAGQAAMGVEALKRA